jgi:hypothetical protein
LTYAIPSHHLAAPRPAPISFEAARAEALGGVRVHGPESETGERTALSRESQSVKNNSSLLGVPAVLENEQTGAA